MRPHADVPGNGDEYAKKIKTLVKAITNEEPAVDNKGGIDYTRRHLEGLKKYTELTDVITKWLNMTQTKTPSFDNS